MAKAEISWTDLGDDGVKRQVYAQHVGNRWIFYRREKRYDQWQRVEKPPLQNWLQLLDAVQRRIQRRLLRPEEEKRVKATIRGIFPETELGA